MIVLHRMATALLAMGAMLVSMAMGQAPGQVGGPVPVYNVRLLTDASPDLTDIPSYLRSITSQYETAQEKAIAIWRWSQRLRKQASNPAERGHEVLDPILLFNSYGHCNCGIVSGLNNTMWLNMGWKAHYVQLGDHTVCETSWDDGKTWHMFDASMSFYCFNDAGAVASVTEIEKNPRFYLENFAPECGTNPVKGINDHQGWRCASDWPVNYKRTLANGWDSFKAPNSISEYNLYAQWGHRFVLNLRPGEHYTRHFARLDAGSPSTRFFRPLKNGKDVEDQHGHQGIRATGQWRYAPDLRGTRAADLVHDSSNVAWGDARKGYAVRVAEGAQAGEVILKVTAANVATSGKLSLVVSRAGQGDAVAVEVSTTAGIAYTPAWTFDGQGIASPVEIDMTPLIAGETEYLVKVKLSGAGAGLESAVVETTTQIGRASLPKLVRGANTVQLTLGPQVETIQLQPSIVAGNHKATVCEEKGVDVEREVGFYKPTLRPASNGEPCYATWKISTPTPIVGVNYGATVCVKGPRDRTAMLHSWDGRTFASDYQKADGSAPFDLMINRNVDGIPADQRAVFLRYEFETPRNAKSYSGPGIQMARMAVQHRPRVTGFTPIEVTYCWVEHRTEGEVERRHVQLISSPAHEYTIHVGGFKDPTMKWVRLNLKGSSPDGAQAAYGYSDGKDVGPGMPRVRERYHWGKNLAQGKSYTLVGAQNARNPDAGGDLTDGIIAPPEETVSVKYMPTNVMFEKDVSPVATIDLSSAQEIAAVRIHAGQEGGFHLGFPASIVVETSQDGSTFTKAGQAEHNQVFDPPADFQPWEQDDSPKYAALPAGGRLAYAYRVIFEKPVSARYIRVTCTAQKGWGVLLSEIQAFDKVRVDKDVPPAVVLPPLSKAISPLKPAAVEGGK